MLCALQRVPSHLRGYEVDAGLAAKAAQQEAPQAAAAMDW